MTQRRLGILLVVLAAVLPYLPTLDDYFVQDDFGVVWLLSSKPAGYFPHWFVTNWMENIWGYEPDEIRPFPALTYQIAALFGPGTPVPNHAINIALHGVNALLVFRIAEAAAGLSLIPAAFAALVFALLPMQSESVAWVTGRVDSMPACVYLTSFLFYVRWRTTSRAPLYVGAVVACFVALFTKQNAVTLPVALVLYDVIVRKMLPRPSWDWMKPYVPFAVLTAGYLILRYALFGEVAREGRLDASGVELFLTNVSVHLKRMAFGEAGLSITHLRAATWVALAAIAAVLAATREAIYFAIVWIGLGIAPTLVAGYASPRHMYLASAGWAVMLGLSLAALWHERSRPLLKGVGLAMGVAVLIGYGVQLAREIKLWEIRSAVSHRMVTDIEREAASAPPGTLFIVDAPVRSWNFALPYALKPPFTREDVPARVSLVYQSANSCCPTHVWEPETRGAMKAWRDNPGRPPVIALRWNPDTGALSRLTDAQDPFLRTVVGTLLEAPDVGALDRLILTVTREMIRP